MDVISKYGLDISGRLDNAPKLRDMASDIAALYAAKKPLPRLTFTEGVIAFSAWPDLAYDRLQIVGEGECRLMPLGNTGMVFDASLRDPKTALPDNNFEPGVNNMLFAGFDIYGASLVFRGIHRSKLQANVKIYGSSVGIGQTRPAIQLTFCIITTLEPGVSTGKEQNVTGVLVDAWPGKPRLQTTASTIANPCLEGCYIGLDMQSSGSGLTYGGTIESCGTGVHLGGASGCNMFYSIDMEGNGKDVIADKGSHNNGFMYCGNDGRLSTNFSLLASNWAKN